MHSKGKESEEDKGSSRRLEFAMYEKVVENSETRENWVQCLVYCTNDPPGKEIDAIDDIIIQCLAVDDFLESVNQRCPWVGKNRRVVKQAVQWRVTRKDMVSRQDGRIRRPRQLDDL